MENELPAVQTTEGRSSRRDRLMGKLFKPKDRKAVDHESAANVDAFLHSSSDNLTVTHAPPPPPASLPKLAKLDTTSISRYPQALAVNTQAQGNRPLAPGRPESKSPRRSPRPNKKGLIVKFDDSLPDVIGEGGDECEVPTVELSKRKKARAPQPPPHRKDAAPPGRPPPPPADYGPPGAEDDFRPKPLSRTQTGFSSIYEPGSDDEKPRDPTPPQSANSTIIPGRPSPARFLGTPTSAHDEKRKSYIEIHSQEMRQQEGRAFAEAARVASATSVTSHNWEDHDPPSSEAVSESPTSTRRGPPSPEIQVTKPDLDYSPASLHSAESSIYSPPTTTQPSQAVPPPPVQPAQPTQQESLSRHPSFASYAARAFARQDSITSNRPPPSASRSGSFRLTDAVLAVGDDALDTFVERTKHLFELFRLHSETIKPLNKCSLKECARGGLWWFLKGRMGLEAAVRDRPTSPQGQMQNDMDRQQAYANLAKGYWLTEEIIPEIATSQGLPPDSEILEVSQSLVSALKKLAMSMKRNGFLPPEDAFLPQTIDKSIWLEYPPLTQDMIALLSGNWGSGMTAMTNPMSNLKLMDAFPVGDNSDNFSYGRVNADVYLMEQGRESQRFHFPCMLSMVRPQKSNGLVFVLASQNGHLQLPIQENKNFGPVWDDVRWRNETLSLEIRLPRGFALTIQLVQQDYRMLWSMYDFGTKIQSSLYPRSDENVVFRTTLRSFQYMDADPNSRLFPKEAVPQCDVALFERVYKENGPNGARNWHLGFRIAVITGPKTRTLSGINHLYPPSLPVQFGFFRGEGDAPSLSLKFDSGKSKGRMILLFNEEKERIKLHSLLTGVALDHDEKIYADVPIKNFMISQSVREPMGMAPFNRMPWKAARVVNEDAGDEPPTVLADKLRVVLEYQNGNVTDRINVDPGELRVRLEVTNAKILRVLRQPQKDITMSVSEAQVPKELPRNLSDALQLLRNNQTIRTFEFNNLKDLHEFQFAMTGFEVIFDALAATFAISRRRMVVPIHKKWEAGYTRIQVVRHEDKQLQLLVFFEDFHHGHCMNFVLKGTDVYENFNRSGKSGLRFVDAKFPLPRLPADKDADYDDMAFVCLDLPDLPGEHDDISILFEKEGDRDALSQCLPAPIKGASRMSSRLK
ncbi:Fc.00g112960.m01.CDS01 [Cosmosporella sp. VM-42]